MKCHGVIAKKKWPHLIVCTFRIKLINQMICVKSQGKGKPVYILCKHETTIIARDPQQFFSLSDSG